MLSTLTELTVDDNTLNININLALLDHAFP